MAGCLPSLKRLFNPHEPRPYLPVDEPAAVKTSVPGSRTLATTSARPGPGDNFRDQSSSRGSSEAASRHREGKRSAGRRDNPASSQQQQNYHNHHHHQQRHQRNGNKKNAAPKQRGESRPTGLFAGAKAPLNGYETATRHQPGVAIDQRTPRMVPVSNLAGMERSQNHAFNANYPSAAPSWAPPTGWIVTSAGGQNARPGPSQPHSVSPIPTVRPSRETLQTPIPVTIQADLPPVPRKPAREPTQETDAALVASVVELPGSFAELTEKEAIAVAVSPSVRTMASFDTMDTTMMQSGLGRPGQLDSVIELPGSIPKPQGRDTSEMVELPGSSPEIMEKDAGPLPPTELPASIPDELPAVSANA